MPTPRSFADKMKHWGWLRDRVRLLLEEVPQLQADHATFEVELASVVALDQEQGSTTAKLRETIRLRDEAAERTRRLRNRLVAGLQAQYGPESERLIEFGVSPRRFRPPRRKPETPTDTSDGAVRAPAPSG